MKKIYKFCGFLILFFLASVSAASGQRGETYTGTVLSYGSGFNTRTVTRPFTLTLNGRTSDQQARTYLETLQESGQDALLKEIDDNNLGYFSLGGQLGRRLNVVHESVTNGQRRIFIVFERWTQFAEVRGGYRSLDYPFGVIELSLDERTGRGEGTYIAAARIRWQQDRKNNRYQVEVENFATFPARLLSVRRSGSGR
jgi:hypothetical protein